MIFSDELERKLLEVVIDDVSVLARSVHQPDLNQVDCHWSILSTPLKTYHLTFSGNPLCKYDDYKSY